MTLFEVVLALSILLVSLAILGELIGTGNRAVMRTELHTQATLLCQSKLAEVVAGIEPLQPIEGAPFDSTAPDWTWNLEVRNGPHPDLLVIAVTANYAAPGRSTDASETLVRSIRRPELFQEQATLIEVADAAAETEE